SHGQIIGSITVRSANHHWNLLNQRGPTWSIKRGSLGLSNSLRNNTGERCTLTSGTSSFSCATRAPKAKLDAISRVDPGTCNC
ncbi:MAG: hypothetical protein DWH99_00005, partial [Planctomycetota bacterium]